MKKICLIIYLLSIFVLSNFKVYAVNEEDVVKENENVKETKSTLDLAKNATSAIMLEASTGEIIFQKNVNEKRPPASMTKMMSMLLIMERIDNKTLSLTDEVTISENAANMGGSQVFLQANETYKVEELLKGIAIASGNDAVVAMAEKVSGSVSDFVALMNEKAKSLGLTNTKFLNPHGLDTEGHVTTAHDMAIIARELIKHTSILKFTSIYEDYLKKNDGSSIWLVNTNKLVRFYDGVDGLKTGFTKNAGYCLTSTAKKNNTRFITVVMGSETSDKRSSDTVNMLNYGFNTYETKILLKSSDSLGKKRVMLSNIEEVDLNLKNDYVKLLKKDEQMPKYSYSIATDSLVAPIKKGDSIGKINVMENNKIIMTIDATTTKDINKANIFIVYYRNLLDIISGNI